ncbi:hypothetical protein Bbelb_315490 [Branchiostoma belcheri]|nr:hypothetical protein Bbelb_315490 [Branchiostoma belcheri]
MKSSVRESNSVMRRRAGALGIGSLRTRCGVQRKRGADDREGRFPISSGVWISGLEIHVRMHSLGKSMCPSGKNKWPERGDRPTAPRSLLVPLGGGLRLREGEGWGVTSTRRSVELNGGNNRSPKDNLPQPRYTGY